MDISLENLPQENMTVTLGVGYKWYNSCVNDPNKTIIAIPNKKAVDEAVAILEDYLLLDEDVHNEYIDAIRTLIKAVTE